MVEPQPPRSRRPFPAVRTALSAGAVGLVGVVGLAGLVGLVGCSGDEFEDRTAIVDAGGRITSFEVDSCGLDDTTAFVVGRSTGGEILQAVVGVEPDDRETGVPARTGLTVTDGDLDLAAFGAEAWSLRDEDGPAPGVVAAARIRGARIQADGRFAVIDAEGTITGEGPAFRLDARCDERDE